MKKLLGIILLTVLVVFSSCNSNTDAFLKKKLVCFKIITSFVQVKTVKLH